MWPNLNSRSQNLEELTGKGFDKNNFSLIPPVGKAASQQGATRLMSTCKPMVETDLNILDPAHNRGKVNRINSFTAAQEQVETVTDQPKGRPVKSSDARSQTQPSTSTHDETGWPQIWYTTCEGTDHLRKDCHEMFSALDAELGPTLQKHIGLLISISTT